MRSVVEEHVLGAAQADALGAELAGLGGVVGGVGVGADLQAAVLVGPGHDPAELAADGGVHSGDGARRRCCRWSRPGTASRPRGRSCRPELKLLVLLIHHDGAAAGHAAGAHAAGHDGGVRGHAAADGQDALGSLHALDILGRGLQADQDHLLAPGGPLLGVLSGEDDLAAGGAGGGGQSHEPMAGGLLQGGGVKLGVQQGVQSCLGSIMATAFFSSIMPSSTRSQAIFRAAAAVRLPLRVWSM